jgi:hypothetical protein
MLGKTPTRRSRIGVLAARPNDVQSHAVTKLPPPLRSVGLLLLLLLSACWTGRHEPPQVIVVERQVPAPTCTCVVVAPPPATASTGAPPRTAESRTAAQDPWEPGF